MGGINNPVTLASISNNIMEYNDAFEQVIINGQLASLSNTLLIDGDNESIEADYIQGASTVRSNGTLSCFGGFVVLQGLPAGPSGLDRVYNDTGTLKIV